MRFAYLVLAHDNFRFLGHLVEMLDDSRNDIFVHIDRKVKALPELVTIHSRLHFVRNRVDVRWGTVSQIRAIMELLREASATGTYDFYHIISGTHMPLKNQDYIHGHFQKYLGSSVFHLWSRDEGDADFKLRRIHFWIDNYQSKHRVVRYLVQRVWTMNMFVQRVLGIRINRDCSFLKADEWMSLSADATCFLLSNEKRILRKYRFSFCCDEYAFATELTENGRLSIADDQELLYTDFKQDHPRILGPADYEYLKQTPYIFARKFDDSFFT